MSRTIYKHVLTITDEQRIATHEGARPLCVADQRGALTIWVEVDTDQPKVDRVVYIVGTGNLVPEADLTYVGTYVGEPFVWHVYIEAE